MSVRELLGRYAVILQDLRDRGVVRTRNAPLGDYVEYLVGSPAHASRTGCLSGKHVAHQCDALPTGGGMHGDAGDLADGTDQAFADDESEPLPKTPSQKEKGLRF